MVVLAKRRAMEDGGLRKYPMILAQKLALDFPVTVLNLIPGKPAWWSVLSAGTMCPSARMMEHGPMSQDVSSMSQGRRSRYLELVPESLDTAL